MGINQPSPAGAPMKPKDNVEQFLTLTSKSHPLMLTTDLNHEIQNMPSRRYLENPAEFDDALQKSLV
jgi:hypothetical protein